MAAPAPSLSVGIEFTTVSDLSNGLDAAVAAGFDFAAAPLFHPRARRDQSGLAVAAGSPVLDRDEPATRSDLTMDSSRWQTTVVGKLSPWLQLDSPDHGLRGESERALRQELQWAAHLGVPAVLVPPPSGAQPCASACGPLSSSNYAAHLVQTLEASTLLHVWVRVPLAMRPEEKDGEEGGDGRNGGMAVDGLGAGGAPSQGSTAAAAARTSHAPLAARRRLDPWEGWNALRQHGECHPRLSVALEVTVELPSPAHIARWAGEPVKAAILPLSVFTTNRAGFPTLSRPHQQLIAFLAQYRVQFLLRGRPRVGGGYAPYLQYLQHVVEKLAPALSPSFSQPGCTPASQYVAMAAASTASAAASAASGGIIGAALDSIEDAQRMRPDDWEALGNYLDVMQAPLQPLADNLESQTYETFERDPVKYEQYEAAIACALAARPEDEAVTHIWVVGAGRGPLVRRALAAADATKRTVRVYAVEKNPNAVITLRNLRASEPSWEGRVTVISSDMRHLQLSTSTGGASGSGSSATAAAPLFTRPGGVTLHPADILVSELLGSFGDNELSPECLDGVMRFLRHEGGKAIGSDEAAVPTPSPPRSLRGVSIPSAYTSFLAPVTSHRLWNEARAFGTAAREETKWLETAYVVRMWRYHRLGEPQPVFTFTHPTSVASPDGSPDNRRYARLRWVMPGDAATGPAHLLHGFGGYFDATLYAPPRKAGGAGATLPVVGGSHFTTTVGASQSAAAASTAQQPTESDEVHISTAPHSHTPGMFSWFPLFFPLRTPVYVRPGDVVEAHMWRCVSSSKVWYEWALASPAVTPVHNPAGRSYAIGL